MSVRWGNKCHRGTKDANDDDANDADHDDDADDADHDDDDYDDVHDEDDEGLAKSGYGADSSISARRIVTSWIYVYHHRGDDDHGEDHGEDHGNDHDGDHDCGHDHDHYHHGDDVAFISIISS